MSVVLAAVATLPASAYGAEAVTDGGFESGGSGWTRADYAGFCTTALCDPDSQRTGNGWAELGGGSDPDDTFSPPGSISQSVPITAVPATLTFWVKVRPGSAMQFANLQATIDGTPVGPTIAATDASYATYKQVTADLAAFADGGQHTLTLTFTGSSGAALARPTFVVDDVSLDIPFLPAPPADPAPPDPGPDPTPTPDPDPTPDPTPIPPVLTCKGKPVTIVGSGAGELLDGSPRADVIYAGGGNDVVRAGAGNDVVCAGAGNDEVKGASGRDRLFGDEGRDKLDGGGGKGDRCVGGPSRDKASSSCEKSKTLKAI
jgi:Ca2+-binding RTX toxin-like protein